MMYLRKSQITTTYNKKYTHTVQSIYLFSFLFAAETFRFNIIVKLHKIKQYVIVHHNLKANLSAIRLFPSRLCSFSNIATFTPFWIA